MIAVFVLVMVHHVLTVLELQMVTLLLMNAAFVTVMHLMTVLRIVLEHGAVML